MAVVCDTAASAPDSDVPTFRIMTGLAFVAAASALKKRGPWRTPSM
jgi:hypothetical protein